MLSVVSMLYVNRFRAVCAHIAVVFLLGPRGRLTTSVTKSHAHQEGAKAEAVLTVSEVPWPASPEFTGKQEGGHAKWPIRSMGTAGRKHLA